MSSHIGFDKYDYSSDEDEDNKNINFLSIVQKNIKDDNLKNKPLKLSLIDIAPRTYLSVDSGWSTIKFKPERLDISNTDNIKKRVLCYKMLKDGDCPYGHNCRFAHGIAEQNVDPTRKRIYNIIDKIETVKNLDPKDDSELYDNLFKLTRLCQKCKDGICTGGLNCREGSHLDKYHICKRDLMYGDCDDKTCTKVKMTELGIVPVRRSKDTFNISASFWKKKPNKIMERSTFKFEKTRELTKTKTSEQIHGVPLRNFVSSRNNFSDSLSETDSLEDYTLEFFNKSSSDKDSESDKESDNESIFTSIMK
jgi:hypothetical protein